MQYPNETFWRRFKPTPGAIGCAEAIIISWLASQSPKGLRMDIGSHAGKAAIAASYGLAAGDLYLVDPCYDLSNLEAWKHSVQGTPENMPWGYVNEPDFKEKIAENIKIVSAMEIKPRFIGDYSENVIPQFNRYSYVFIDSDDHCGGMAIREAKLLENRMVEGGIIGFHDVGNQFQDPREAINYLVGTGKFEEIIIDWKYIFDYVRGKNLESDNNSWHERGSNEFPCYVGAVRRK